MKPDDDTGETLAALVEPTAATTSSGASRIGDRYEIIGLLGVGGMGTVYKVRDLELDELVALKRLKPDLLENAGMLARFRQEVKLARRVTHPNVVRTFDLGESGDERYLTMEYIDGPALSALIARDGALPLGRAVAITKDACNGLAAAHKAGVLHRDLKPDNVLIERPRPPERGGAAGGRVVLTDFGIARAAADAALARTIGGAVGTPAYMSPEQVQGREADARADIYAIGALLYELITGRRAWPGEEPFAVALARLSQPVPDPRLVRADVPDALADVVIRCMARDPRDRPASAEEVVAALDATLLEGRPVTTRGGIALPASAPAPVALAIAVLPLRNGCPPDDAYIAEGLTEELVDTLSTSPGLRVRPLSAALKVDASDPREAGRALGVQVVVEGSVRRAGDRIRVSVRLLHVQDGYQVWAQRFEGAPSDVLDISDKAANAIATALAAHAAPAPRGEADAIAIDLYLRGRAELRRTWNTRPQAAYALLAQARERAPQDPAILSAYATACVRCTFQGGPERDLMAQRAREAANLALQLAPQMGEPWVALASVEWNVGDPAKAAAAAKRATLVAPGLSRSHEMLGMLLLEAGRVDQALAELELALALDPSQAQSRWEIIRANGLLGRWSQVDKGLAAAVAADENAQFAHIMATTRLWLWREDSPPIPPIPEFTSDMLPSAQMAMLFAGSVRQIKEKRQVEPMQRQMLLTVMPGSPGPRLATIHQQMVAEVFGFLGEADSALDAIERAIATGLQDLLWMRCCPVLAVARTDPRWAPLLQVVEARAAASIAAIERAAMEP